MSEEDMNNLTQEDVDLATKEPEAKAQPTNTEKLGMDDMDGRWIRNPQVGEETEVLTVKECRKNYNVKGKTKEGVEFETKLSGTDKDGGRPYKIDVYTDKGIYSLNNWEVWGKLKRAFRLMKDKYKIEIVGVRFKVAHVVNGMYATKKADEVRRLEELPNDEAGMQKAQALIDESKEAKRLKKCYVFTLYTPDGEVVF